MLTWKVYFTKNAANQARKLNKKVITVLDLLIEDLREYGPFPGKN